jgi:hypothetical protein
VLKRSSVRTIILIWIAWAAILFLFQAIVPMRLGLRRPDFVLDWTPSETGAHSQDGKPYLIDSFLNEHVAWDSEYYLSIAVGGYDDPIMRRIPIEGGEPVSQNYAFFPLYSHVMQVVMIPLGIWGLSPIAVATLAGLIVGLIGTLFGLIGLYGLVREELGEGGAIRAAFYLLIFPTGFFLAQVYTEGLFIGLAFCSLALMRHQQLLWAALLAALAVWTRAVGVALLIPLALAWGNEVNWKQLNWRIFARGLVVLIPAAAYLAWHFSPWGANFRAVEENFFGRGLFLLDQSQRTWSQAWQSLGGDNTQATVYYLIEFGAVGLALVACLLTLRRYPGVALFGLGVLAISVCSGWPQSQSRYMLAIPSSFILLSRLGRRQSFDRAWTLASVLVMGMLVMLFSFDMWVA